MHLGLAVPERQVAEDGGSPRSLECYRASLEHGLSRSPNPTGSRPSLRGAPSSRRRRRCQSLRHLHAPARQPTPSFSRPVELEAGRTDDQYRVSSGGLHGRQRLHGLAQAHLIGKKGPMRLALSASATAAHWNSLSSPPRPSTVRSVSAAREASSLSSCSRVTSQIRSTKSEERSRPWRATNARSGPTAAGLAGTTVALAAASKRTPGIR